ncbi:MAG: hypothetical protein KJZ80_16030 [Hyphomicrobiaceae bacterium]|nr:hypothetical protein [Hyphomicrobiaceae bacterium]
MSNRPSVYAGRIAHVDLTSGTVRHEPTSDYARRWIGGRPLNTALVWDAAPPGISWDDPCNALVFGAGVLCGTLAPGSARVSVDSKNAFNDGMGSANVGGFFGAELKFAGFDHLVITGRAPRPVYLWVRDGEVEIRDADFLWGETTWETEHRIRTRLSDERIRVAAIGPAGENRVRSACIICDRGCSAGGSGCGAVMGSKNLKAVAVRGKGAIGVARAEEFMDAVYAAIGKVNRWKEIRNIRGAGFYGALGGRLESPAWEWGYRPVRNGQDEYWGKDRIAAISAEKMQAYRKGTVSCFSCPISCKPWLEIPAGEFAIQGEGWWNNSANSFCTKFDNTNLESAIYAHYLTNQLGLDGDDAAQAISWAFECYEHGLITSADTDGLELTWGNHDALVAMLNKLARREGFGDFLADGAVRAAERLGKGSEQFVIAVKGQDSLDGVRINKGWGFGVVLSPVAGRHLRGSLGPFWQGNENPVNSYKDVPALLLFGQKEKAVQDMLGYCSYVYGLKLEDWTPIAAAALGCDMDADAFLDVGLKAHNLEKAFNALHTNFSRKDDYPCDRYYNEPVASGPFKGERLDHPTWDAMLDEHYRLHGWDVATGLQTRSGLTAIGMADVADRLARHGRLIET